MGISLMALEIHFSDTGGRRESLEQMDSGPSLEDIIVSMQQHLRCSVEGSDVVYDRSRGNRAGGIGRGFNAESGGVTDASQLSQTVYTAPWTYANTTDGIYGDGDASECDEVPLPVLTREMLRRHTYAENECTVTDADHDQELNFDENDSVQEALDDGDDGNEFLDPVAHPRLSTPFYQQLRVKYPQAFHRRSSITSMTSEVSSVCPTHSYNISGQSPVNWLPSRPPLPPCLRKGVNFCVDGRTHDNEDTSIVGCCQRQHRSWFADRSSVPTPLQGILKKDTPFSSAQSITNDASTGSALSLKERLKKNRETFQHLMSDENSPFGRRKKSCDRSFLGNDKAALSSVQSNSIMNVRKDGTVQKRTLAKVRTKRSASPDSTQDSAIDMDSASMQSDTHLPASLLQQHSPKTQQKNCAHTSGLLKLRSRQKLSAGHNSDWPNLSKPPVGISVANHGKDSDEDSGIAYSCLSKQQIRGYRLGCRDVSTARGSRNDQTGPLQDHPSGSTRTTRKDHCTAALSTMNGPLQVDLSMDQCEVLLETDCNHGDRYHERQVDMMETMIPYRGRSSSVTQRHREVTFEDEIPCQPLQRACSQPLLNSCSEAPSDVRTLHQVLHFSGEISDVEPCHHKAVDNLHRYHSEDDLVDRHVGHSQRRTYREHASRRRCASAMAEIITATQDENIESSMEIHRASPAVVLTVSTNQPMCNKPPRPPANNRRQQRQKCLSSPDNSHHSSECGAYTLSDTELNEEVMCANGFIPNGLPLNSQHSDRKRFHLPWRKNRGRYTPSKEIKKMERAQSHSFTHCASGGVSSSSHQMALTNGRSDYAEPPDGQKSSTKRYVTAVSEMTSTCQVDYETVREYRGPMNINYDGNMSSTSPVQLESDYETVDISKTNKLNHDCAKPPTGRKTSQKRHATANSDRNYETVTDCTVTVKSMDRNCNGHSVTHLDSDYETVDVINRTNKPHSEPEETSECVKGQMIGNMSTQQDHTQAVYAKVDFSKKTRKNNSCATMEYDESITELPQPPLPFRGYEGDLQRHRGLSGSRASLADKMGGFRQSMKRKFSRLRKAVSLDRLDKAGCPVSEPTNSLAGSFWKSPSLTSLTSHFRKKNREGGKSGSKRFSKHAKRQSASMTALDDSDTPKKCQPIGRLQQINCDGTQVIELSKPKDGPFGFYIARGSAKYNHAIFVSRLSDSLPGHFFAGLLNVGDEIIEINGTPMKNITLEETYDLMAKQNQLQLKIMPFMARRDT